MFFEISENIFLDFVRGKMNEGKKPKKTGQRRKKSEGGS